MSNLTQKFISFLEEKFPYVNSKRIIKVMLSDVKITFQLDVDCEKSSYLIAIAEFINDYNFCELSIKYI